MTMMKKIYVEGGLFLPGSTVEDRVREGLNFILEHVSQPHFPRKVSTAATNNEQKPVSDKDRTMLYYQGALWEDCRIAGFRIGQENPDLIFIDLDAKDFSSMRSFKLALTRTLKNIKQKLGGAHPSILWSGRGYHIIQPIDCPIALETIKELAALEPYTSNKFLQFAERYLTDGRCDKANHPALKSCMLRIPGSVNSRCKAEGSLDPEVKIIQKWDGHRPDYRLLLGSFYADLVGQYKPMERSIDHITGDSIWWIEKLLLQTPIEDYRKRARDLIIVPYLVVRKGMTDPQQISDIVMQWADKCSELKSLQPSRREFEHKVRDRAYEVMRTRISQMKLATLKVKYPGLYEVLKLGVGD
jgi:hypothetical protein